jgi:cobalt transporter subunit CbtB
MPQIPTPSTPISVIRTDARAQSIAAGFPALATVALGLLIVFCVGFMQVPAVHNGAHDTRHANGFPCH